MTDPVDESGRSHISGFPNLRLGRAALGLVLLAILGGQMALLAEVGRFSTLETTYQIAVASLFIYMFAPQVMWGIRQAVYRIGERLPDSEVSHE